MACVLTTVLLNCSVVVSYLFIWGIITAWKSPPKVSHILFRFLWKRLLRAVTFWCTLSCHYLMYFELSLFDVLWAVTVWCTLNCHYLMYFELSPFDVLWAVTIWCTLSCHFLMYFELSLFDVLRAVTIWCTLSCHCLMYFELSLFDVLWAVTIWCTLSCHYLIYFDLSLFDVLWAVTFDELVLFVLQEWDTITFAHNVKIYYVIYIWSTDFQVDYFIPPL